MINGRVERCADNIMRRIVPARREGPTRTEPLERPSSGPRERNFARPRRRETCFYLHFPEPGVLSRPKIFSSLIFRNVTRLLPRRAFSIFLEIQRIAQSREDFSSKRFLLRQVPLELLRNRERMLAINIYRDSFAEDKD